MVITSQLCTQTESSYGCHLQDHEYINNGQKQDLLSQITYPQGGSTTVSYKSSAQYVDDSGNPANKSPYPIFTVSQIVNSDGFGNNTSSSYQYQGGTYFYQGPFDKQFSGYKIIKQTDGAGNVTKTYYNTGTGNDSTNGQYQDNYFKIGKPYRVEQYNNSNNLYQVIINKWEVHSLGGNAGFVKLVQATAQGFDGTASHKDKPKVLFMTTPPETKHKKQIGERSLPSMTEVFLMLVQIKI